MCDQQGGLHVPPIFLSFLHLLLYSLLYFVFFHHCIWLSGYIWLYPSLWFFLSFIFFHFPSCSFLVPEELYTWCCVCLSFCLSGTNFWLWPWIGFKASTWDSIVSNSFLASNSFMGATHHVMNLLIVQNLILKSEPLKCDSDISRTMYTPSKFLVH